MSGSQQENTMLQMFHKANDSGHGKPATLERDHNALLSKDAHT